MSVDVAVLVPAPAVETDPWAWGAVTAATRLEDSGASVDLRVGIPDRLPDARVVVCHGVQYAELVARGVDRPVVVSDLLPGDAPSGVTTVDWCWPEAAAEAGRQIAESAHEATTIGFVAGPAVPTQRRVLAAFVDAVALAAPAPIPVAGIHVPSFDDRATGARAGAFLVDELGCSFVAHSADAAGAAATDAARAAGAATFGFLRPEAGDRGYIRSDIAGVLALLAHRALEGTVSQRVFRADAASGFGGFVATGDFGVVTTA